MLQSENFVARQALVCELIHEKHVTMRIQLKLARVYRASRHLRITFWNKAKQSYSHSFFLSSIRLTTTG